MTIPSKKPEAIAEIQKIETVRPGTRVLVYWLGPTAKISQSVQVPLYDHLRAIGHQSELAMVIQTRGGDTEAPWRIVSMIREFCDRFVVMIPHLCHSAGTVLALGADEIVMTGLASLGPIDPSRTHPLLPRREGADQPEPVSVQDMRHAMEFIREAARQGLVKPLVGQAGYTPDALAQVMTALFEKIHPLAIGAIEQSYTLAKNIGKQCLSTHMSHKKDIDRIVNALCDDYKSHGYQISRGEARDLGLNVRNATTAEEEALLALYDFYTARPARPTTALKPGDVIPMHIAWLDATSLQFRVQAEYSVEPDGQLKHRGDEWARY